MAFKVKSFISPLHAEEDPKKPKPKTTSRRFPDEYYNVPNAKPYKRNSDGSVQMITTKGSTYSLRKGTDK